MLLGFSRQLYVEFSASCASEACLAAHARAFACFGGMPRRVLCDNAKVVALEHARTVVTFNEALLDFAGRRGFRPQLCRPYRPQTKGKVERTIGHLKDAFLVGRLFTDLDDMNARVLAWLDGEANTRVHATTGAVPAERLPLEGLTSISEALPWESGHFLRAYEANQQAMSALALEMDRVAIAIIRMMQSNSKWSGTATQLLDEVRGVPGLELRGRDIPGTPRGLSNRVHRLAPLLRERGLDVQFHKGTERLIVITNPDGPPDMSTCDGAKVRVRGPRS